MPRLFLRFLSRRAAMALKTSSTKKLKPGTKSYGMFPVPGLETETRRRAGNGLLPVRYDTGTTGGVNAHNLIAGRPAGRRYTTIVYNSMSSRD